jgi:hypothetical protein
MKFLSFENEIDVEAIVASNPMFERVRLIVEFFDTMGAILADDDSPAQSSRAEHCENDCD